MGDRIISHKLIRSRKVHQCLGCAVYFPPRSSLWRCTSVSNDEISSGYWCESCQEKIDSDPDPGNVYYLGDLADLADLGS